MRILIADDDFASRKILENILIKKGYETVIVENGDEALKILQQPDSPVLAILDWMMPEKEGVEVCRIIREKQSDCPPYIILLTMRNQMDDVIEGLEAGANDYLVKPFDPDELCTRVEVGFRMIQLQQELNLRIAELRQAYENIKTLQGIIPVCSYCKNIRDDKDYWQCVEEYIEKNPECKFSHGICPDCMKKHFPQLTGRRN